MKRTLFLVPFAALMASSCAIPIELPDSTTCRADMAIGYIGQRYTQRIGRIVKAKTQATYVRTVAPDTMVTQEFRANRVNLALDDKNLVTRIYCG